jgi:hypothetical protein
MFITLVEADSNKEITINSDLITEILESDKANCCELYKTSRDKFSTGGEYTVKGTVGEIKDLFNGHVSLGEEDAYLRQYSKK